MKYLVPIVGLCLAPAFAACGDADSAIDSGRSTATAARLKGGEEKLAEPKIRVPNAPPPKELIVRDIREGTGPVLEDPGDEFLVKYVGAYYDTGDKFFSSWNAGGPSKFLLEEVHKGWELGLKGMRVGGRRELIEPSDLAYGSGTAIYVIDLIAVKRATRSR